MYEVGHNVCLTVSVQLNIRMLLVWQIITENDDDNIYQIKDSPQREESHID